MATVVQTVQLLAGLGSCVVALVNLGVLSRIAGLIWAAKHVIRKPCPQCQARMALPLAA